MTDMDTAEYFSLCVGLFPMEKSDMPLSSRLHEKYDSTTIKKMNLHS